jgi:hypothetical protein
MVSLQGKFYQIFGRIEEKNYPNFYVLDHWKLTINAYESVGHYNICSSFVYSFVLMC